MQLQGRQLVPGPAAALQLRPLLVDVRGILLGPLFGARVWLSSRVQRVYGPTKLLFQKGLHGELGLTRISGHPTSADEIVRKEASNGSSKVQSGIQS